MSFKISIASRKILGKNGASRIILKQADFFKKLGADIFIYTERCNKNIIPKGIKIKKFFSFSFDKIKRRVSYASNYETVCKNHQINLSIGNGDTFFQNVLFMHNIIELEHKLKNSDGYKNSTIFNIHNQILKDKKFKILINNSIMMKDFFCEKYDIPEEKSFVLYPGYDSDIFNTNRLIDTKNNFRRKHGIGSDFVIGFVTSGNLLKRGIDIFFDSILILPKELLKNVKIVVVGHKKDVNKFIKDDFLAENLVIVEPFERIEELYKSIDIMVHPARIEEFGMVVLEAMACGVPVLTSKMVGASEIYIGDLKDIVVDEPRAKLFAEKISKILKRRNLQDFYGKIAIESVKPYTWDNYMNKLVSIYKSNNLLPEGF